MENSTFIVVSLFDVRVIMTTMCVLVMELSCRTVMEQIPVLKCLSARRAWAPVGRSCPIWH
jgi:hypothetical protein